MQWPADFPSALRHFDDQNMQDMNRDEQEDAKTSSRRVEKLGKAFQNYRRAIINILRDMFLKNVYFLAWRHQIISNMTFADLVWTEDDMEHFLRTVASFETHKRLWLQKRQDRKG